MVTNDSSSQGDIAFTDYNADRLHFRIAANSIGHLGAKRGWVR